MSRASSDSRASGDNRSKESKCNKHTVYEAAHPHHVCWAQRAPATSAQDAAAGYRHLYTMHCCKLSPTHKVDTTAAFRSACFAL
eukprot:3733-Heterococcus_DN1.PRE.2